MPDRLKNIVAFTNVAAGGNATLPHGIVVGGRSIRPDLVIPSNPNFTITAVDATDITVNNGGAVQADCNVLADHWHSIVRAFGNVANEALSPQPFIVTLGGGGGGVGDPVAQAFIDGAGPVINWELGVAGVARDGVDPAGHYVVTLDAAVTQPIAQATMNVTSDWRITVRGTGPTTFDVYVRDSGGALADNDFFLTVWDIA